MNLKNFTQLMRRASLLLAVGVLATACSPIVSKPSPVANIAAPAGDNKETVDAASYHIGVGDEIEVKFFFAPELNDLVQVRPDGKISLMFASDVVAAGKTTEELQDTIKQKVTSRVRQADMVVVVRTFGSQKAYVNGEVGKPGPVQLTGGENLLQVLAGAGWITPAGRRNEVVLMRCCHDGKQDVYALDVDKIVSGEDMSQNVVVLAGDQIMVPPSDAVAFDRWMDQHVRQALPLNSSAVLTNQWTAQ